ncbi:hypothetical protein M2155_000604 [Streptomyces sp. SAI-119]|uniref:hypothetical protein n=1 Tax=Streptomyces sp. SAI-119 TaxID=2940541 RepID=UPI002473DE4C|nr:hypothetical protein [Streptomyces sp. SAI-119]MDH6448196.1 hypothetical protein [Streptomyces sp. SAI-119]
MTDAAPAPTVAEQFPCRGVRFVNGRTEHRTKRPRDNRWWDLLEAACGKTGYKTDAYTFGTIRDCRGCAQAIAVDNQQAA